MNTEQKNEADGLGACRGVRSAIPLAIVWWAVFALVVALGLKLAGVV